jgi:pentatricopeptide repeat protein
MDKAFSERGLKPDQCTYFTVVRMLMRAKRGNEALRMLKEMQVGDDVMMMMMMQG